MNGLEACLLCNKINVILGYKDQEVLIRKLESELPIKDVCDLKFKGQDILWLTSLKKKSVIGMVVDDLKYNVIMGYMPNDYDILKEYALKKVDNLVKYHGFDLGSIAVKTDNMNCFRILLNAGVFIHDRNSKFFRMAARYNKINIINSAKIENRILPFQEKSFLNLGEPNKMIVISDGDVIKNQLDKGAPIELGFDKYTGQYFGNKEFILNSVNYLLDDNGLINIRSKDVSLPILDKQRVQDNYSQTQLLTVALPIVLLGIFGMLFTYLRKKKYNY